ncbi:MAG: M28 family peptidase [Chitinophagales bacterium]
MIRRIPPALFVLNLAILSVHSQKLKKSDKAILSNLQSEIKYLADDKLEGRRAGSPGEKLAADFILSSFTEIKLQPMGNNSSWKQSFEIYDGKQIALSTHFIINNKELQIQQEYFPLAYSAQKSVDGTLAIALQESGVPWFIDLKEIIESNQNNPHFDLEEAMHSKVQDCQKKGATAIVFFNSSKTDDHIIFNPKDKSEPAQIPVLYMSGEAKRKWLKDESATIEVKISVGMNEMKRTANNVIGFLDNHAATTIIIGAHYDHLGYGEDGSSLYRGQERQIHNGADDNASGTAGLIELARMLKQSRLKKNNYLFIAFSGEELGLLGSKYFTENPTVPLNSVNYMINMDMIGRLNDSTHLLTIGGYGTSPTWGEKINGIKDSKNFSIKIDSSGSGPSDYTSFYRKDIPVLFFFTGLHGDYHKPTDDYDKINYTGELQVVKFIYELVENINTQGKLAFAKTREMQTGTATRFSVTLGILPDYAYNGTGVRLDGVSDGRPAQKAGLKVGDIIVKLGDFSVYSLENYMQALSKFKKGDRTIVSFKRGNDVAEAEVQF